MSADRDVTRIVQSWLESGVTALPDRVLDAVLDQIPATPQRRPWWPARRIRKMNNSVRLAVAAAAVVVVALAGISLLPGQGNGPGAPPSAPPSPTEPAATPAASTLAVHEGPLSAGTYEFVPCTAPPCPTSEESMRVTIEVPGGWTGIVPSGVWIDENAAPGGAALAIGFGGELPRDPCLSTDLISTGSTVDEFANAISTHPVLDATDPIDVTLGGYAGTYIDLQLPADLSECPEFRPWVPGIYAQGPDHRWHLWVLDVEGTRVVVQSMDYPGTSPQRRAELEAMVESIEFRP